MCIYVYIYIYIHVRVTLFSSVQFIEHCIALTFKLNILLRLSSTTEKNEGRLDVLVRLEVIYSMFRQ